jgi:hypothetical protein
MNIKTTVLIAFSFVWMQLASAQETPKKDLQMPVAPKGNLTFKIIPAEHNTWGYDIYNNNKMFVHQPSVPGAPGLEGFKSKARATKVANLVIGKIKKGISPPTVTQEELNKL